MLLAACVLLSPAVAAAQEDVRLTGSWSVEITSPEGLHPAVLALSDEGGRLSGVVVGAAGPAAVDGTRGPEGVTLRFTIAYEGAPMRIVMRAPAVGPELAGSVDFGGLADGTWSARPRTASGVSGAWTLTADDRGAPVSAQMLLVEDAGRVSGRLLARSHGIDGLVKGTLADDVLQLSVDAEVDGAPMVIDLPGRLSGESLAGTFAAGNRSGRWTAVRQ